MRTTLNNGPELTMTSQEAEAVLNLLNQRQQELEALRARTTVQDLAEATSMPTSEIQALLAHVRQSSTYLPPAVQPKKVKRYPFLIAFAVVVWIGILAGFLGGVYEMGLHRGRNIQRLGLQQTRGMFDLGSGRVIVDKSPIAAENIPVGVSVTFDGGYTVDGENKGTFYNEELLASALGDIVDNRVESRPDLRSPSSSYNYEQSQKLPEALRTGNTTGFESIFRFEEIQVSVNGVDLTAKIPVETERYGPGYSDVQRERERRLSLLANKMVRLLKEGKKS